MKERPPLERSYNIVLTILKVKANDQLQHCDVGQPCQAGRSKESPLGEVKDLTDPKDVANLNKKRERHVTGYNIYELEYNGLTWIVKTEVFKNTIETVYCLYPKEK